MERVDLNGKTKPFTMKDQLNPFAANIDPESVRDVIIAAGIISTLIGSISLLMYRHGWLPGLKDDEVEIKSSQDNKKPPEK